MIPRIETTCDFCGKSISREQWQKEKYANSFCSLSCAAKFRTQKIKNNWITTNCDHCNKEIKMNPYVFNRQKTHFCSRKCSDIFCGRSEIREVDVKCKWCNSDFKVTKKAYKQNKYKVFYCNLKCVAEWRKSKNSLYPCDNCGKEINVIESKLKRQQNIYCCEKCEMEGRGKLYSKENNPMWKGGATPLRTSIRNSSFNDKWRRAVFARDKGMCVICGSKIDCQAHHLESFSKILDRNTHIQTDNINECGELLDIDNGVTLCKEHHKEFHAIYTNKNFTKDDFYEYSKQKQTA